MAYLDSDRRAWIIEFYKTAHQYDRKEHNYF